MEAGLGPLLRRAHTVLPMDDVTMECVLHVRLSAQAAGTIDSRHIGFIAGEEQLASGWAIKAHHFEPVIELQILERICFVAVGFDHIEVPKRAPRAKDGLRARRLRPSPSVAEPEVRQEVEVGSFRASIECFDANTDVIGLALGVLDKDVEVAVRVKDAGVEQLEFEAAAVAAPI